MLFAPRFSFTLMLLGGFSPALAPHPPDPLQQAQSVLLVEYNCELAQLSRADELIDLAFAPILDDLVERGNLAGWVWLLRDVGDEWSRAFYITASDRTTLLAARDEVAVRLTSDADPQRVEFLSICRESRFRVYRTASGRPAG